MKPRAASLVEELARPLAMGHLTMTQAIAALTNARLREADIEGDHDREHLADQLKIDVHLLKLYCDRCERARMQISWNIGRAMQPNIRSHVPSCAIRANAHDMNAENGALLTEDEVDLVIVDELQRARGRAGVLAPAPPIRRGRRRYGR